MRGAYRRRATPRTPRGAGRRSPRWRRALAAGAWALRLGVTGTLTLASPGGGGVAAHHVGAYAPRDNEVSANFKQLKFAIQAQKLDVALRLFDDGALQREMRTQATRLPAGLEDATRAALRAGDGPNAEVALAVFFAALARDLALEADAQVAERTVARDARAAAANRFLEAIWRYWNLVDFVVSQRDLKSAVAIRLAYDEAETLLKGAPAPAGGCTGPRRPASGGTGPADPERLRPPLQRIAQALARVVDTLHPPGRRQS